MDILRSATAAMTAGQQLTQMLMRYQGQPTLLLLSGGSAVELLTYVDTNVVGSWLTISTLDERYSTDATINNFAQLQVLPFCQTAVAQGAQTISTAIRPDETLIESGARFEHALREWRSQYPYGQVVAVAGVGADGHTAGIFAGEYGVDLASEAWVAAYSVPTSVHQYTDRITVTYTFLRTQVTEVLVYVAGLAKQPIVEQLQRAACTHATIPAGIFNELSQVTLVTDQ